MSDAGKGKEAERSKFRIIDVLLKYTKELTNFIFS